MRRAKVFFLIYFFLNAFEKYSAVTCCTIPTIMTFAILLRLSGDKYRPTHHETLLSIERVKEMFVFCSNDVKTFLFSTVFNFFTVFVFCLSVFSLF